MPELEEIINLPGTKTILAASHFPIRSPSFYQDWAVNMLTAGIEFPGIVELAGIPPNAEKFEISNIIKSIIHEIGAEEMDSKTALSILVIETLADLPSDVDICWKCIQSIRLIDHQGNCIGNIQDEIELLDLELSRAGETGARFDSVKSGIDQFRLLACKFSDASKVFVCISNEVFPKKKLAVIMPDSIGLVVRQN